MRWIAWGWAAVLCAVLVAQTYVRAERPDGIDLTSYLLSARAILNGASPYLLPTPFPYLYPATLAFLLIPLTFVPPTLALVSWFGLNVAAAVWSIRAIVLRARPELAARPADVAVFLAVFFTFFFTIAQSNLRNGQVNFVVLALCVTAIVGADPRVRQGPTRRSAPTRIAIDWSLAVTIKILPLALLPFFALRRSWLWLVASMVLIVVWCLLPAVVLGSRILDIYQQYWRVFLAASLAPAVLPLDFSLAATIAWAARAPLTPVLSASAAAVVIGWIIQADARRMRSEVLRPSALYLLAIPLASPHSEVHHLAFMLPAAALVFITPWNEWRGAPRARVISTAAAAIMYLVATASPIAKGPLFCAALIAFGIALMHVKVRLKPDTTETNDETTTPDGSGGVRLQPDQPA